MNDWVFFVSVLNFFHVFFIDYAGMSVRCRMSGLQMKKMFARSLACCTILSTLQIVEKYASFLLLMFTRFHTWNA